MDFQELQHLFNNKAFLAAVFGIGGALVANLVAAYRNRIKIIEYTVTHDRVGLAADDVVFGAVRVTWQGAEVTNLYTTTITIENTTSVDFTNLRIKIYTDNTLLLTQRLEIAGTTYVPRFTDEYSRSIEVPHGAVPSDVQFNIFRHQREYLVSVLNRGQLITFQFLTTVPNQGEQPGAWVDLLHPSAQVAFKPITAKIHGVPIKLALSTGLLASLVIFILLSLYAVTPWIIASIAMLVGLMAQSIGAWIYRMIRRFLKVLMLH